MQSGETQRRVAEPLTFWVLSNNCTGKPPIMTDDAVECRAPLTLGIQRRWWVFTHEVGAPRSLDP